MSKYPKGEIGWGIRMLEEMVEYDQTFPNKDKEKLFRILIDARFLLIKAEQEHDNEEDDKDGR